MNVIHASEILSDNIWLRNLRNDVPEDNFYDKTPFQIDVTYQWLLQLRPVVPAPGRLSQDDLRWFKARIGHSKATEVSRLQSGILC